MRLCLTCGHVDEHRECSLVAPPRTSQEKVQRVQRALADIDRTLFALKMSKTPPTRTTLMQLVSGEGQLERFQAKDLADFGQKRAYNLIETALKEKRREVEDALGDAGARIVDAFPFTKKALELAFRVATSKLDATSFDASALAALPAHPVEAAKKKGISLRSLCSDVDARLEETRSLDAKVRAWGWKNLTPLVTGKEPLEVPDDMLGGGMLGIVGRGSRRASAVTQFKLLGDEFRERLYLLAANPILLGRASSVSQAEESWRKHLANEGATRWESIRRDQADLLEFFLGPVPDAGTRFDEVIAEFAKRARSGPPASLLPFETLDAKDWESLGRAYFLIYDAVLMNESSSESIVWDRIARGIVERKSGGSLDRVARQKAVTEVRESWQRRPPGEGKQEARS